MDYAIALASEVDSWKWVQRAEQLGFSNAWFYDTHLLNPDVFICMALAASKTQRIRIGTGVLVPTNRIEPVAANALATLNKIAPNRIDFGVGTGFTARRTMGLNAIPLAKTKTYIERVSQLLNGETVSWDFEGKDRKIRFLDPELGLINIEDSIPLWLSAFGEKSRTLTAELGAGWINFGIFDGAIPALQNMQQTWQHKHNSDAGLKSNLFFLGAVLTGDKQVDDQSLMRQAGPMTSTLFHNIADQVELLGGAAPEGPFGELYQQYATTLANYQPEDAKYIENHKGHLMYVRPDETHITPELVRQTSMSGEFDELVDKCRQLKAAGYSQLTVQLVHGQEHAIEDWAKVFEAV